MSECRNKSLHLIFQLMDGNDYACLGMDKIQVGWRAQHWCSIWLGKSLQPDRVKLVLPMESLISQKAYHSQRLRIVDRTNWNCKALVFSRSALEWIKPC